MGDEHDEIVKILAKLCDGYGYGKVHAHHIPEEYEPLLITLPRRGRPLAENYYPDIWAERKRSEAKDIYEVWHSENELEAVQDIIYSALVKKIKYVHIVCTGYNITKERAKDLSDLIIGNLNRNGYQGLYPDYVFIAEIPEKMRGNKKAIKKHLSRALRL